VIRELEPTTAFTVPAKNPARITATTASEPIPA